MHKNLIFFLTVFTLSSSAILVGMETISLPNHKYILNGHTDIMGYQIHYQPRAHVYQESLGEKIFSNVCGDKVFTIIDCGNKQKSPYCQTSLLDLETGIDRPYQNLSMRATACHLLNAQTPIVGYQKLFFLHETFNILRSIKNIYEQPRMYTLEITQTLKPVLGPEDQAVNDDTYISTIDSCDSHLVAIASNGFITTWEKNGPTIDFNSRQKGFCDQPFFSAGFNKKEKMICLGLKNGKIFVTNILNLDQPQIVNLFPQQIKVNWISVSENNFLFAGICKTKKELWQQACIEKYNESLIPCCKHIKITPQACATCQHKYKNARDNTPLESKTIKQAKEEIEQIEKLYQKKYNDFCEHTTYDENSLTDICNACRTKSHYTVASAIQVKKKLVESKIVEYDKKDNQVGGFYLVDDEEIILTYQTKKHRPVLPIPIKEGSQVLLKSLKTQETIDFRDHYYQVRYLIRLIDFILLPRENGEYTTISNDFLATNKPDSMSYINKSVRRIIAKAPYYWAPFTVPIQFIISFIKTPQLSIPTAVVLLLFLYRNSSTAFHVE